MLKSARAFPDNSMSDLTIPILFLLDGLIAAFLAVWAHEIGLDPNTTWGLTRFFLLSLGAALIFISALSVYVTGRKDNFFTSGLQSETTKILFSMVHIWVIIFLIYAWFITYGNWTTWNHTTSYYDQLANAFDRGQLNIDIDPGAALRASPNPYDPAHRPAFNSDIWDMSLYKGKLYLYWGPVPAMLIAPIKLIFNKKITDNILVFLFFSGLLIFNSLILLELWKKFFKELSAWYPLSCILLAGLILPILWSVNSPRVYEAAIGASQFFLVGGIFFVLSAFDQETKINETKLFLAGLFWACSVGSRALNALSIIFLAGLVFFWIIKNTPRQMPWTKSISAITALMVPLMIGVLVLGWYNWARFGSPFEFGFRYQITILDLNKQSSLMFLPDYFFLNLYTYVFQPFEMVSKFPFIQPGAILDHSNQFKIVTPQIYFVGRMTGLLFCAPFLVFSLVHFRSNSRFSQEKNLSHASLSCDFVVCLLAGSFIIGFLGLMFFFFGQMRYLVDVISQITLLAVLGYWKIIFASQKWNHLYSKIFLVFANSLIFITICISLLLAFSSDYDRLKTLNPALFERIVNSLSIQK
jgi:hypothetical protein